MEKKPAPNAPEFSLEDLADYLGEHLSEAILLDFAARATVARNVHEKLDIGAVFNAAEILEATGLRLEGYRHKLDNFGIRHGFNRHGKKSESKRRQRAVSVKDVALIPLVVHLPDKITHGGYSKAGRTVIQFKKCWGQTVLHYRAEVRPARLEISTVTFFVSVGK